MDLRTLECFVAVAEDLHFRKAAARLNLTQPSLSVRIQGLEQEVAADLFRRDRRSVQLTEAGRAFLEHARAAIRSGAEAVIQARRAARGEIGRLRFGFTALTSYAGMPELIRRFKQAHPEVEIDLFQTATGGLETALLKDEIDVALLHPPVSMPGLALQELEPDPLILAMPSSHELASLSRVPLRELAGQPFLIGPRSIGAHLYDQIILACRQAGFSPSVVQEVASMTTLIGLVAAGIGCGLVIRSLQVIQRPGVVFRPLSGAGPLHLPTALAWRKHSLSPVGARMLEMTAAQMVRPRQSDRAKDQE